MIKKLFIVGSLVILLLSIYLLNIKEIRYTSIFDINNQVNKENLQNYDATDFLTHFQGNEKSYLEKIILNLNLNFERHKVVSKDGYVNTIWRVNKPKPNYKSKPILLQHGFLDNASVWFCQISNNKCNSLPCILADEGYDVWLANFRGTIFSQEHLISFNWKFSIDELVNYDFTSFVRYIKTSTNTSKIHIIGHSQGGYIAFLSYMNDPIFFEDNIESLTTLNSLPLWLEKGSTTNEILISILSALNWFSPLFAINEETTYKSGFLLNTIFKDTYCYLSGWFHNTGVNTREVYNNSFNCEFVDNFNKYKPENFSVNNAIHWLKIFNSEKNLKFNGDEYNTLILKNLNVKSLFFICSQDYLIKASSIKFFQELLPSKIFINLEEYNHTQVMYSPNAVKNVYLKILNFIKES